MEPTRLQRLHDTDSDSDSRAREQGWSGRGGGRRRRGKGPGQQEVRHETPTMARGLSLHRGGGELRDGPELRASGSPGRVRTDW